MSSQSPVGIPFLRLTALLQMGKLLVNRRQMCQQISFFLESMVSSSLNAALRIIDWKIPLRKIFLKIFQNFIIEVPVFCNERCDRQFTHVTVLLKFLKYYESARIFSSCL